MKIFLKRLEVINWDDIASCSFEFDRENINNIHIVQKSGLPSKALLAVLDTAFNCLPDNCAIKLDVMQMEKNENEPVYTETLTRYIKIRGISTIFNTKIRRGTRLWYMQSQVSN